MTLNKKLLLSIFCLTVSATLAAPRAKENPQTLYDRGMTVFQVDPGASMALLQRAARMGHVEAMIRLGHCYQTGTGTRLNKKDALKWYEESYAAGSAAAINEIAAIHEEASPKKPADYAEAITWYERGVTNGSLKSCEGLARIYASCPAPAFHDGPNAIKYAAALIRKNPEGPAGFDLLAAAYARDLDFTKALKAAAEAITLSPLDEAAERRERRENYLAGKPFPAIASDEWIMQAAEKHNLWAMLELARLHGDRESESYNLELARHWYEQAAEEGSPEAFVELGHLCRRGHGGPVDEKKAFWCFSEAAKAEAAKAYAPLARLYVGGRGTQIDLELARKWYKMAVDAGEYHLNAENQALREFSKTKDAASPEELYAKAKHIEKAREPNDEGNVNYTKLTAMVFQRYWIAAERGNLDAMNELADMYYYGERYFIRDPSSKIKKPGGIRQNFAKALEWYEELERAGVVCEEKAACAELQLEQLKQTKARKYRVNQGKNRAKSKSKKG